MVMAKHTPIGRRKIGAACSSRWQDPVFKAKVGRKIKRAMLALAAKRRSDAAELEQLRAEKATRP